MNRRKALKRLTILGGGVGLALAGAGLYHIWRRPSLELLEQHRKLLGELAETIIPQTDSPGAKAAGVGDLIIRMVRDCTDRKSQNNFLAGLTGLDGYTKDVYGRPFGQCSPLQRSEVLRRFEKSGAYPGGRVGKAEQRLLGESFFSLLKQYTVFGYCSSERGATEGLRYDYIPGKYVGMVPLRSGDRAWATQ